MAKRKTNKQVFASLFKEIGGSIHEALLRERILKIMEMTMISIEEDAKAWDYSLVHPSVYEELNTIVQKHLNFNN